MSYWTTVWLVVCGLIVLGLVAARATANAARGGNMRKAVLFAVIAALALPAGLIFIVAFFMTPTYH